MKFSRASFFLIVLTLGITLSCNKEEIGQETKNNDIELTVKTVVLDEITKNSLVSMDSTTLVYQNKTSQTENFKIGEIVVSDITEVAEYGYLRKIEKINRNGNTTTLETSNATIAEAIKNGEVAFNREITDSDIMYEDDSGEEIDRFKGRKKSSSLSFTINKTFDLDGGSKINFNGQVSIKPTLQFDLKIKEYELEHYLMKYSFANEEKISVSCSYNKSLKQLGVKKNWIVKTIRLKPLVVTIGYFPIILDQWLVFVSGLDGKIETKIQGTVASNYTAEFGIEYYKNSGWATLSSNNNKVSGELDLEGVADLEGWAQARYEIRPYGINAAKIFVAEKVALKAEGKTDLVAKKINLALKLYHTASAVAQMQMFSSSLLSFENELYKKEHTLFEKTIPLEEPETKQPYISGIYRYAKSVGTNNSNLSPGDEVWSFDTNGKMSTLFRPWNESWTNKYEITSDLDGNKKLHIFDYCVEQRPKNLGGCSKTVEKYTIPIVLSDDELITPFAVYKKDINKIEGKYVHENEYSTITYTFKLNGNVDEHLYRKIDGSERTFTSRYEISKDSEGLLLTLFDYCISVSVADECIKTIIKTTRMDLSGDYLRILDMNFKRVL